MLFYIPDENFSLPITEMLLRKPRIDVKYYSSGISQGMFGQELPYINYRVSTSTVDTRDGLVMGILFDPTSGPIYLYKHQVFIESKDEVLVIGGLVDDSEFNILAIFSHLQHQMHLDKA